MVTLPSGIQHRLKRATSFEIDRMGDALRVVRYDGQSIPVSMLDEYVALSHRELNYEQKSLLRDCLHDIAKAAKRADRHGLV